MRGPKSSRKIIKINLLYQFPTIDKRMLRHILQWYHLNPNLNQLVPNQVDTIQQIYISSIHRQFFRIVLLQHLQYNL